MMLWEAPATNSRYEELKLLETVLSGKHLTLTPPLAIRPGRCRVHPRTIAWLGEGSTVEQRLKWTTIIIFSVHSVVFYFIIIFLPSVSRIPRDLETEKLEIITISTLGGTILQAE